MSKYIYNKDYFEKIDNADKAYWLGFIYADGCISKDYKQLIINLNPADIKHLELFNSCIESNYPIIYMDNGRYITLRISRKDFVKHLVDKGCVPHKSLILQFPSGDKLPRHLVKHFIRGYFDGDGSVYLSNNCIYSSFTGTENMLLGIKKELNNLNLNTEASVRKYPEKDIYDFKLGGTNIMQRFYHILYDEATIFMNRKRNIFNDYFNNYYRNISIHLGEIESWC